MDNTGWLVDKEVYAKAFVRGLGRQSVDFPKPFCDQKDVKQPLSLLAAIASRQRFDRPTGPTELVPQPATHQNVTPVSGELRSELVRYFSRRGNNVLDLAITRVFATLKARDLHIHPFDYVALGPLIRSEHTNSIDLAFLSWIRGGAKETGTSESKVSEDNWLDVPMTARCHFISELHRLDPERARTLLREHLGAETAANRAKLVECISDALTLDDREFLEGFSQDRSKIVREIVRKLLSGIPGTSQYESRLSEACSRLVVKTKKLTGSQTISVDKPKHIKGYALDRWYEDTFSNIDPEQLCRAVDIDIEKWVKGLQDEPLAWHCFEYFVKSDKVTQAAHLLNEFPSSAFQWVDQINEQALHLSSELSDLCWSVHIEYAKKNSLWLWCEQIMHHASMFGGVMPDLFAKTLLKDKQLKAGLPSLEKLEQDHEGALLEVLVCLLPSKCYLELGTRLDGLSPLKAAPAKQLMNLITLAESSTSVEL